MLTLAALSGPLPKLGTVVLAALAGAALLAARERLRALAVLGALVLAPVLLLADIWHSPQLSVVHRHPLLALVGGALALLLAAGLGLLTRGRPAAVALPAVAALPFRVPISVGGATANLLVPLYLVVLAASLGDVSRAIRAPSGRGEKAWMRPAERPLEWLLAGFVVLYALQAVYSSGFEKALQQVVFFYVPFALLFSLLRRLPWSDGLVRRCLGVVVVLAVLFSVVGFIEYATKTLLLNPRLVSANQVHTYFTVNSVFFDPDIFGRFLALVMVGLTGVLLYSGRRRTQLASIGLLAVLWACLVLTLSRSSLGALLVGMAVLAALRWRVMPVLALSATVLVLGGVALAAAPGTFGLNQGLNGASSGRAGLVTGGLSLFAHRPVWGWGSGSFVTQYRAHHPGTPSTLAASHTIAVTVAAEQGVIGLLAYAALVAGALAVLLRGARGDPVRVAVAAAFIALVFHTLLYADFLEDPVTWALLGLGAACASIGRARPAPPSAVGGAGTAVVAA